MSFYAFAAKHKLPKRLPAKPDAAQPGAATAQASAAGEVKADEVAPVDPRKYLSKELIAAALRGEVVSCSKVPP